MTRRGSGRVLGGPPGDEAAQLAEGFALEPGDVHLGNAEAAGDLGLGEPVEEPETHDLFVAAGQVFQRPFQGGPILQAFDLPVIGRYFPEFEREVRRRLESGASG